MIKSKGVLDYCCHYSGVIPSESEMPAILAPKAGKFGVKIVKIHGSLNWLLCPQCARIMVNRDEKIGIKGFEGSAHCRFCGDVKLTSAIALPSFRKNFDSFHFQHIWHQAAIELASATRLVFIGYSFPMADFDFRTLVTKRVGDCLIDVILGPNEAVESVVVKRYRDFFGDKIREVYCTGVAEWVKNHHSL
jgi:hypothetical protein